MNISLPWSVYYTIGTLTNCRINNVQCITITFSNFVLVPDKGWNCNLHLPTLPWLPVSMCINSSAIPSPIIHEYYQVRLILYDMNIARIPPLVWHKQLTHARSGYARQRQAIFVVGLLQVCLQLSCTLDLFPTVTVIKDQLRYIFSYVSWGMMYLHIPISESR